MNILQAIELHDVGVFKSMRFEFPKGLSTIYGLNRASGKNSQNSNAVGKSHLVSSIAELLYDEPIIGEKSDRTRQGTRILEYKHHSGKRVRIVREAHGKSEKVSLSLDGKDPEHLTATKAKAALRRWWPISVDEYNTYVHLDSRIPHPLVMGSTTERKRFFTSFFGLDRMDAERKLFQAALSELKKTRAAFDELRAQYERDKAEALSDDQLEKLRTIVTKGKKRVQKLQASAESAQEALRVIQFMNQCDDRQLRSLALAMNEEWTEESFQTAIKDNDYAYKKAKSDLQDAREYEKWQERVERYQAAMASLPRRAIKLISKLGLDKATAKANKAQQKLMELKREHGELIGQAARIQAAIKKLEALEQPRRPDVDAGELAMMRRAYKHQLEHARKFKSGNCETCGQIVKIQDPSQLKAKLEKVQRLLDRHAKCDLWDKQMQDLEKLRRNLKIARTVTDEAETLQRYADLAHVLRDVPSEPPKFKGARVQVKVMERVWDEVRERKQLLDFFQPHIETVIAAVTMTDEQKQAAKAAANVYNELAELQAKIARAEQRLETHEQHAQNLKRMRKRLKKLKTELENEEALKLLVDAYSDKKMKKMAVEAIGSRLMQIVNKYARIVFPEDYYFSFEWSTQINMLVHRRYGKRVDVSDVRKLSGAESKLFTVILVLAMLSFVPPKRRCSCLILDEPTANFSPETTSSFMELLPVLNKLIPSIVIITPKSQERFPGAKEFTIVKTNGVAEIVEGHPDEVRATVVTKRSKK